MDLNAFLQSIQVHCDPSHLIPSRMHPLRRQVPGAKLFVKREDECGFALPGPKRRKYASLLPWLQQIGCEKALIVAGANSNNLLGLTQLLIERGIEAIPVVRELQSGDNPGNAFLSRMLVPFDKWLIIPHADWSRVEEIAATRARDMGSKCQVIPEGAFHAASVPGALTLLPDVLRNEAESGLEMQHLICEAGTGLTAMGMIAACQTLSLDRQVHILLMADQEEIFRQKWAEAVESGFFYLANCIDPELPDWVHLHVPSNARSFGSFNQGVRNSILETARSEGILTDPVYSGKLFYEAYQIIKEKGLEGNILLIHAGGANTLPGYFQKFRDHL